MLEMKENNLNNDIYKRDIKNLKLVVESNK